MFACSYGEIENWWFRQYYEFDSPQLPDGITLEIDYEYSVIGEFHFSNKNADDLFLVVEPWFLEGAFENPTSVDEVSQNTLDKLDVSPTMKDEGDINVLNGKKKR